MKHAARLAAVVLSGVLLIPAGAQEGPRGSDQPTSPPIPAFPSTNPSWVGNLRGVSGISHINYIDASNEEGNIYIAGSRLAKYDVDGVRHWVREPTAFYDLFFVAAGDDRIYTSEGIGLFTDSGQFAGGGVTIHAYTPDGDSLWTIIPGETFEAPLDFGLYGNVLGMGLDRTGNIYAAGVYNDSLPDPLPPGPHGSLGDFGTFAIGDIDVFLASYTPEGGLRWSQRIASPYSDSIMGPYHYTKGLFAVDDNGNAYLGGCFREDTVFGEGQPREVTLADKALALASFDADGNLRWVRTADALGIRGKSVPYYPCGTDAYIHGIAVDAEENLLILSNGFIPRRMALAKFAPDGASLWIKQLPTNAHITSNIATDDLGHVYVGGSFSGGYLRLENTILYPPDQAQPPGKDGFVAHYDAEGDLRWVGYATGTGPQYVTTIAVGPSGDFYAVGAYYKSVALGSKTLESEMWGEFLAKYPASTITSSETTPELPSTATLTSNYPNPFTHTTTIEYALPASGQVHLSVYDVLGREVAILVDGVQHAGKHASLFDGMSLPSGTYLYRLEASGQARTGLMTLMK